MSERPLDFGGGDDEPAPPRAPAAPPGPPPARRAGGRMGWLVGADRLRRARLHDDQHAANRLAGLARPARQSAASAGRHAVGLERPPGGREHRAQAGQRWCRPAAGVRGARTRDPQHLPARRAGAGGARVHGRATRAAAACASSTRSSGSAAGSRACSSPRWAIKGDRGDAADTDRPASAGASRSATTTTAPSPTSTPSPYARR